MHDNTYDVIIVGAGLAGISAALSIEEELSVLLLTKDDVRSSNSYLAQGGIAIPRSEDIEQHIEDTLRAGHYENDAKVVRAIIENSNKVLDKLITWEVQFDRTPDGRLRYTKEGGHTSNRVLHIKDQTGKGIIESLVKILEQRINVMLRTNEMVSDLLVEDSKVKGVKTIDGVSYYSNNVILATGGVGKVYPRTTNESSITGDGIALAINHHVKTKSLHLVQFHPTCLKNTSHLITEALRGEGAYLITEDGSRIMEGIHPMSELAPRDVIVKRMNELILSNKGIYLDARHLSERLWVDQFPHIDSTCLKHKINPRIDLIPVEPVEHYLMGGIMVDSDSMTSITGLYAIGEVAYTGFHGNNRLASNSLLEAVYYGVLVGENMSLTSESSLIHDDTQEHFFTSCRSDLMNLQRVLQNTSISKEELMLVEKLNSQSSGLNKSNREQKEMDNKCIVAMEIIKERYKNEKNSV